MKERLIAFLSAVVRDYASKEGDAVHRIELIGGSAHVPVFEDAIHAFIHEEKEVKMPEALSYTMNSTESLAEGGCLMDMCVENKTLSDTARFTLRLCTPIFFEKDSFRVTRDGYCVKFARETNRQITLESDAWKQNTMLVFQREKGSGELKLFFEEGGAALLEKHDSVFPNNSVFFYNPCVEYKFPEAYFFLQLGGTANTEVGLSLDQNGLPCLRCVNTDGARIESFYVPQNHDAKWSTIRWSMERVEKKCNDRDDIASLIERDEKKEGDELSVLERALINKKQCDAFEAKRNDINRLKNQVHEFYYDHEEEFNEDFIAAIESVMTSIVNGKETVEMIEKTESELKTML